MSEEFKISAQMTKKQLIEEHERLLEAYRDKERAAEAARREREAAAKDLEDLEKAREATVEGIMESAGQLRTQMVRTLNELVEGMSGQAERLEVLNRAVDDREKRLEELDDVEQASSTLAALLALYDERKATTESEYCAQLEVLEEKYGGRSRELREDMESRRAAWEAERQKAEANLARSRDERDRERGREEEEYTYVRDRERRLDSDKFDDARAQRERELAERLAEKERELAGREETLSTREKELAKAVETAEQLPARIAKERDAAASEAREAAVAETEHERRLAESERQWEKKLLTDRVSSLEKELEAREAKLRELKGDLDAALLRVQQLAEKALDRGAQVIASPPQKAEPIKMGDG